MYEAKEINKLKEFFVLKLKEQGFKNINQFAQFLIEKKDCPYTKGTIKDFFTEKRIDMSARFFFYLAKIFNIRLVTDGENWIIEE